MPRHEQRPVIAPTEGDTYPDEEALRQKKIRQCLRCKTPFESAWNGERICRHCKNSGVWKQGLTSSTGNKRALRRSTPATYEQ